MTTRMVDDTQRTAAKIAGLAYLISFASVVPVNFGIFARLIVRGNPAETARNILAHESLFRIGIAGDIVYCVSIIVLLTALYIIFKPVNQTLSLLAASGRMVHGFTWLLVTANLFTALRLLVDTEYSRLFGEEQLYELVRLHLSGHDQYYIGLLFWSMAATIVSYLWVKSNYIPRAFAVLGVISSAWCVACTFMYYIFPDFANVVNLWWFDSPMSLFEIGTGLWLLFKGLNSPGIATSALENTR